MANTVEVIITAKDQTAGALKGITGGFAGLAGIAKSALLPVLGLVTAGVTAVGGALAYAISEAMEAQEVQAQLNAVLESTGGIAGVTAEMANDLATSLSGVTRFSDEAIVSAQSLLLTFTNIGADIFPEVTKTALDLATAFDMDLQSATIMLGKAFNDPIAGLTALGKAGVQFTDEQKEMITAMVEAGDVAGAQALILAELETQLAGSAIAAGETFAGQLDILKNALSNVAETIGTALLPIAEKFLNDFIIPLLPKLQAWAAIFKENIGPAIENIAELLKGLFSGEMEDAGGTLANIVYYLANALGFGQEKATEWFNAIIAMREPIAATIAKVFEIKDALMLFITETLIPFVTEHKDALIAAFIAIGLAIVAAGIVAAIAAIANPVTLIIVLIGLLAAAWVENWGGIRTTLTDVWNNSLLPLLTQLDAWLRVNVPLAIQTLSDFWTGTLLPAIMLVWDFITGSVVPLFTALWDLLAVAGTLAITALTGFWQNVLLPALTAVWDFISVYLQPIFTALSDYISTVFGPVVAAFAGSGFLGALQTALGNISTAISDVIKWIESMIAKLGQVELPWWLTPGSPTPFELGLAGIRMELDKLSSVAVPAFAMSMSGMGGSGPANVLNRQQTNIYGVTIQTNQGARSTLSDLSLFQRLR